MAIAKLNPDVVPNKVLELPSAQKETYLGIVADNNDTATASLVAYLDGMPWSVDYYGQLMGKHNDLRELDPGQNASFQQYQKTTGLELRVGSSLATSYDSETGVTSVTGNAIIIFIVPNVNDYFIADAGSRQAGLFRITSVERKVFNRDSVYEINYTLVAYVDAENPLYVDLEAKVVRQYRFSKERLTEGLSPVLKEEVYALYQDIGKAYKDIVARYFQTFFNRTNMKLVVPGQSRVIYDHWLVDFLTKIMDSLEAPQVRDMCIVSIDHERYLEKGGLFQALLSRDYNDLKRLYQRVTLAPKSHFNASSWIKSALYWGVDFYVYPIIEDSDVFVKSDPVPRHYDFVFYEGTQPMETDAWKQKNTAVLGADILPLIKSVLIDDYYILSREFYEGGVKLSVLEVLIKDYLKCQTIDIGLLAALVNAYPDWPALERFYYGPLLLLLMKESIKGFYR